MFCRAAVLRMLRGSSVWVDIFAGRIPPVIVCHQRVVELPLAMNKNCGGTLQFITAASQQPIHCHGPSHDKTMLRNSLTAVFGTGRVHGANATPDRGQVIQGASIDTDNIFIRGWIRLRCGLMRASPQKNHADHHQACAQRPIKARPSKKTPVIKIPVISFHG